jgi:hypothetical protein
MHEQRTINYYSELPQLQILPHEAVIVRNAAVEAGHDGVIVNIAQIFARQKRQLLPPKLEVANGPHGTVENPA